MRCRTVARYEAHVAKLDNSSGFIDLFWPGVLIVEQKSAGRDLEKAYKQARAYFDALPERKRPRYILVSDFQTFELHDLDERQSASFSLAELSEDPGYPDVVNMAQVEGINVPRLPVDRGRWILSEEVNRCKCLFVTPSHHTITMPLELTKEDQREERIRVLKTSKLNGGRSMLY